MLYGVVDLSWFGIFGVGIFFLVCFFWKSKERESLNFKFIISSLSYLFIRVFS